MTIKRNLSLFKSIVLKYKLIPLSIALFFFFLQTRFLHLAAYPNTDEGVYAEAGRMIMRGFVPHSDFPLYHMPLLPIMIGLGLKILPGMYYLRLIYVLVNCLSVVPLYITLKKIQNNTGAVLLAILFYLTFYEMVRHDFRFLAIRQLANVFFICFFYLGIVQKHWKYTPILQTLLSVFSVLLFLPTSFNLLFVSLAIIFSEEDSKVRNGLLKRYVYIGLTTLAVLACYFIIVPNSFNQTILEQVGRDSISRIYRLKLFIHSQFYERDKFFYGLSFFSLMVTIVLNKKLRYFALAMIGIMLISLWLPSTFYFHYLSAAGPAFAFGIFAFGTLIFGLRKQVGVPGLIIIYSTYILLFLVQLSIVSNSLMDEWLGNKKNEDYFETISVLSQTSEPLIASLPIFAVEAKKELLIELAPVYMRSLIRRRFTDHEYDIFASRACTIFLDRHARAELPTEVIERWSAKYTVIYKSRWGKILKTNNQNCEN